MQLWNTQIMKVDYNLFENKRCVPVFPLLVLSIQGLIENYGKEGRREESQMSSLRPSWVEVNTAL